MKRDIRDAMVRAATSKQGALEASAVEIHQIALFACKANDALAWIRLACETAEAQGGGINPKSILDFLDDNQLNCKELHDGEISNEDQGCQSACAAVA